MSIVECRLSIVECRLSSVECLCVYCRVSIVECLLSSVACRVSRVSTVNSCIVLSVECQVLLGRVSTTSMHIVTIVNKLLSCQLILVSFVLNPN